MNIDELNSDKPYKIWSLSFWIFIICFLFFIATVFIFRSQYADIANWAFRCAMVAALIYLCMLPTMAKRAKFSGGNYFLAAFLFGPIGIGWTYSKISSALKNPTN